jgi:hypothetical protein
VAVLASGLVGIAVHSAGYVRLGRSSPGRSDQDRFYLLVCVLWAGILTT